MFFAVCLINCSRTSATFLSIAFFGIMKADASLIKGVRVMINSGMIHLYLMLDYSGLMDAARSFIIFSTPLVILIYLILLFSAKNSIR